MPKTVNLQEIDKPANAAAAIAIVLQGFTVGAKIELKLWEDDLKDSLIADPKSKTIQEIGKISGEVVLLKAAPNRPPLLSLKDVVHQKKANSQLRLLVAFPQPDGAKPLVVELNLPNTTADVNEGESWELFATVENELDVISPTTRVACVRRALSVQKGEATYYQYAGNTCRFYHDGSANSSGAAGYFADLVTAIGEAKHFIFIADWSFHPHMRPVRSGSFSLASTLGAILINKAVKNPSILIAIHAWDHTIGAATDRQNDDGGDELDAIAKANFGLSKRPANLLWRISSRTGFGYSHHQKFVVMDAKHEEDRRRMRAFVGGLDITKGRFDWASHPILPDDPEARDFLTTLTNPKAKSYDDWYNAEFFSDDPVPRDKRTGLPTLPRQPWHDIALMIVGPPCWDIVREFVGRWLLDPSLRGTKASGDTSAAAAKLLIDKYQALLSMVQDPGKPHHSKLNPLVYAQQWDGAGGLWAAQLLRSMKREHWEQAPPLTIKAADHTRKEFAWTVTGDSESSILRAYLQAIGQAEEYIYIETQYFISSGAMWSRPHVANRLAESLALRAIDRAKKGLPFHVYLVLPMFPEGDPSSKPNAAQRQFQWNSIVSMAQRIERDTGQAHTNFLSVFFLAKWHDLGTTPVKSKDRQDNVRHNKRYQIYVHSKFMLVDDRYMIIGSANLNERSLAGNRDSEIALHLWPSDDSTLADCITDAQKFRMDIWAEHLGKPFSAAAVAKPASPACVKFIQDAGLENYKAFRAGKFDAAKHGHLCRWPIDAKVGAALMQAVSSDDHMIPDWPAKPGGSDPDEWRWHAPGTWRDGPGALNYTGADCETAE